MTKPTPDDIKRDIGHDDRDIGHDDECKAVKWPVHVRPMEFEPRETVCNCTRRDKIALLERLQEPCEWVSEDMDTSIWLTGCGEEFWFDEPPEGIIYCPHCGHPVKIKAAEEDLP